MAFSFVCSACGKRLSIPPPLYEKKIRGRVVTIGCKICGADISVDATDVDGAPVVSVAPPPRSVASPAEPAESAAPRKQAPAPALPPAPAPTRSSNADQRSSRTAMDTPVGKPLVAAPRPPRRAARESPPEQKPKNLAKGPPPAPKRAADRPTPIAKKPESPPLLVPAPASPARMKGSDADVWHAVTEQREPAPAPSPPNPPEPPKDTLPAEQSLEPVRAAGEPAAPNTAVSVTPAPLVSAPVGQSSAPVEPVPAAVVLPAPAQHGLDGLSVWRSWKSPFALGFFLILALATAMVVLLPRRGTVSISASGPGGESLHVAQVIVDEKIRCNGLPCRVTDLAPTDHVIRVVTSEYGSAERVVGVRPGRDQSVDFPAPSAPVTPLVRSANPVVEQTGQVVETKGANPAAGARLPPGPERVVGAIRADSSPTSTVLIDGRMAGQTPLSTIADVGPHKVAFLRSDYERKEVAVEVEPHEATVLSVQLQPSRR